MPGESISVSITADDRASKQFRQVGNAALDASGKIGIAALSQKAWNDASVKSAKADATSVAALKAHTKAAALLADAEAVLGGHATKTTKLFADQHRQLGLLSRAAEDAAGAAGSGGGGSGLLATIAGAGGAPGGIGGIAAGLAALPFAAQAASGGIVAALGGGLAALGVIGAARTKEVQRQFGLLSKSASTDLGKISQPFDSALVSILAHTQAALAQLTGPLRKSLQVLAPSFKTFGDTLVKSFASPAVGASIKAVAAAFGGLLRALAPQLPGDIKDVATGITRVANSFARGAPQFAAVISFFFKAAGFALSMVSALTNVAVYIERHFIPALMDIRQGWDQARHQTAVILDGMRHEVAHVWDSIFNDTIGTVIRGVKSIVGWFGKLPGEVIRALFGLGHQLYAFGHAALDEFWSGLKSVGGSVLSWVGNFVSSIWNKVKGFFGIHSPSSLFYDIGKNLMLGLFHGIKDHAHHAVSAASAAAGKIGGGGGGFGASALQAQAFARSLFPAHGWSASQWPFLLALWNQESGWSATARNPSSGAAGIPQDITGNFHGGYKGQVIWGEDYIAGRYRTPAVAWAHEKAFNWYGAGTPPGGLLFSRPTVIGVGERGPERVSITPPGGGGQQTIVLEIAAGGEGALTAALLQVLRKQVRIRGGSVQHALGQ